MDKIEQAQYLDQQGRFEEADKLFVLAAQEAYEPRPLSKPFDHPFNYDPSEHEDEVVEEPAKDSFLDEYFEYCDENPEAFNLAQKYLVLEDGKVILSGLRIIRRAAEHIAKSWGGSVGDIANTLHEEVGAVASDGVSIPIKTELGHDQDDQELLDKLSDVLFGRTAPYHVADIHLLKAVLHILVRLNRDEVAQQLVATAQDIQNGVQEGRWG